MALIDDFNRADSGNLGGNWTLDPIGVTWNSLDTWLNHCRADQATAFGGNYYNAQSFGPDCDVSCDINAMPTTGQIRIMCRLENAGLPTATGYELEIDPSNAYLVRLNSDGSRTTLEVYGSAFAAGNKMKLEAIGTAIKAYRDSGAGFVQIMSQTDATHAGSGSSKVAVLMVNDLDGVVDNFNATTIGAPPGGGSVRRRSLMGVG